ncbi:MAG: hypothetical protein ABIA04_04430 [Pseudomonadota bacterium]
MKRLLILALTIPFIMSCAAKVRTDMYERFESYGFVTLKATKIFETENGHKVIGELPKYYNFKLKKDLIEIDNGLVHIFYETKNSADRYPDGWVKINDVKLLSTWEYPVADMSTQRSISAEIFPITSAKANQFISEYDKNKEPWDESFIDAISKRQILLSMTKEMVLLSVGIPDKVNKTKGNERIEEQWIYNSRGSYRSLYIYITDGKVINTQIVGENIKVEKE